MKRHRLVSYCIALAIGMCSGSALAENVTAIAMHGDTQYAADFDQLTYVNPDAPKGGSIRMSVNGSFDSLNHHIISGTPAAGLEMINDKLMTRVWDEPFTLAGLVAQSADISDDRSEVTFHLNPAARFHDGHPMTADDVLFSFEAYKTHGHPVRRRVYGFAVEARKIDAHTVYFRFGEGYDAESVMILAMMPVLPKHYWDGKDISKTTLQAPLGSGPYRISNVIPGRRITLERVEDYWAADFPVNRGLYNFDVIDYLYFRDDAVSLEAFKAGNYDLRRESDIAKWFSDYHFPAIRDGRVLKAEIPHGRPEWVRGFIINTRRAPFDDIRVRKALGLAFDFEWMNRTLFHGAYKRIESYFPNSTLAAQGVPQQDEQDLLAPYADVLPPDVFGPAWQAPQTDGSGPTGQRANLREAAALLREAGMTIDAQSGLLRLPNGRPFVFEMLISDAAEEKIALQYARWLKRLGIVARVRTVDSAQFAGRLEAFEYDMVSYRWINSLSPGNEQVNYFGSDAAHRNGSRNYAGVDNSAIDALAKRIGASASRDALVTATHAYDRALTHGYYIVPFFYTGKDYVARARHIGIPQKSPTYGIVTESFWDTRSENPSP